MEGHHARPADDTGQQGRDVRVAEDGTRPSRERLEVHPVQDAGHAVPAADAPNCVDAGITKRGVEVGQTLVVRAGEVPEVTAHVGAEDRFVIQRTAQRLGACYIVLLQQGAGRRHERDATSAIKSRRSNEWF